MDMPKFDYNSEFHMDSNFMDDEEYIAERIASSRITKKVQLRSFENLLRFLYTTNHPDKANRTTIRNYLIYFSELEQLMLYRLGTRCTGSERFNYGINAVKAIKRDKYMCQVCGEKDIRCIEIDHLSGRTHKKKSKEQNYEVSDFQTLCANHHRIKTRMESLEDDKREKRLLKLLQSTISNRTEADYNEIERLKQECDLHSHVSFVMKQVNDLFNEINDK